MKRLALVLALSIVCPGVAQGTDSVVAGRYMEDRSNRVYGCPCEWSSEWAQEGHEAVLAWLVDSGIFRGVDLRGLRIAAVLLGTFTLSEATTLRRSIVYIDSGSAEHQRQAGEAWLRSRFGDTIGTVQAVRTMPLELQFTPTTARLRIAGILEVRIRQADLTRDTMSWAAPLYDPFVKLESAVMATSLQSRYDGPELAVRWSRAGIDPAITGYFGTFVIPQR